MTKAKGQMLKVFLSATALFSATPTHAGCFSTHLHEATAINRTRQPLYEKLTDGKSIWISRLLIATERMSLPVAWYFEWKASSFQKQGIPLLCEDFVPMNLVPTFTPTGPAPTGPMSSVDTGSWTAEIKQTYAKESFAGVHRWALAKLAAIAEPQGYHCMVRHVLESIARIAFLAPQYDDLAQTKKIADRPGILEWQLIEAHLWSFSLVSRLDRMAAPLQARGVPILCQDVPPIATEPRL